MKMESLFKNKKLFAILFWIWVALILYFTLTPIGPKLKLEIKDQSIRLDYFFHFLVYFGLSMFYLIWKADNNFRVKSKLLILFLFTSIIFSFISEIVQNYIPNRSFNPIDFYFNSAGIISGIFLPTIIFKLIWNSV